MEKQERHHGPGYKDIQNGPINSVPDDFIPSGLNPDNNAYFDWVSNPLSSKGNSVSAEETKLFYPTTEDT